ncbi:flagellar hook-basal body complex protein FliE [Thermodesulfobium narugense DSM 14796]|uniref:Flagellar hook-basal body complex protein FliE n=1 Tax=Thermodesulfobium narugense DSM 14796 TaxID=747365 RepID=M1E5W1_9BACT|nr:flagellar hook-basal body complex protein FliE [Thermodesulfobium narugense]AEE15297.1 flagellar hook-basal body complex protein FliE [Thermodesulfobium narugense DSM 14796]
MKPVEPINPNITPINLTGKSEPTSNFKDALMDFLGNVNSSLKEGDRAAEQLAAGKIDLPTALIKQEDAVLSMQLLMSVRSELIGAYQDLSRIIT